MRLDISRQARRDINHIHHQSLMQFGEQQAAKYVGGLLDHLNLILATPNMARIRPELGNARRLLLYKSHVIFYRIDGETIHVVRILHGKQNWREHL